MTETNEILGRPINGDIPRYTVGPGSQDNPQNLIDAIDHVLDFEGVEAVQWEQFTPGFNDGEPCEFGTGEVTVKLTGFDEDEDYSNGFTSAFGLRYGSDGGYDRSSETVVINGVDQTPLYRAMEHLGSVLGPNHYVFLNETFGDPAQVTATKEGFDVEYYDCGY